MLISNDLFSYSIYFFQYIRICMTCYLLCQSKITYFFIYHFFSDRFVYKTQVFVVVESHSILYSSKNLSVLQDAVELNMAESFLVEIFALYVRFRYILLLTQLSAVGIDYCREGSRCILAFPECSTNRKKLMTYTKLITS